MTKKEVWRFPNLSTERRLCTMPDQIGTVLAKGIDYIKGRASWEEVFGSSTSYDIDYCYAYGMPLEQVYEAMRWQIVLDINYYCTSMLDPESLTRGSSSCDLFFRALLIDDNDMRDRALECIAEIDKMSPIPPEKEDSLFNNTFHALAMCLVGDRIPKGAAEVADRAEKAAKGALRVECMIARRDEKGFNRVLEEEVTMGIFDPPAKRARKRQMYAPSLVSLDNTGRIALALHHGLRLTYVDTALPIWDFPIAKRPEIQKLLPPEVLKRIPT